jgi:rhodanese-related sulfurtransferase
MTQQINPDCLAKDSLEQLLATDRNSLMVIDVRSPEEYAEGHISMAVNIPLDSMDNRLNEIDKNKYVVTVCWKGGGRSATAVKKLKSQGYQNVQYLCDGTSGWFDN